MLPLVSYFLEVIQESFSQSIFSICIEVGKEKQFEEIELLLQTFQKFNQEILLLWR